ncbi:MAG: hypothetical protein KJ043_22305, partial [Anaerolineae bacterium]|nr:hypothetical protein [Anaerolineae bacterium]
MQEQSVVGKAMERWRAWEEIGASGWTVKQIREGLRVPARHIEGLLNIPLPRNLHRSKEDLQWDIEETNRLVVTGAMRTRFGVRVADIGQTG